MTEPNKTTAAAEVAGSDQTQDPAAAVSIASEPELEGLRDITFLTEGGMSTIYKAQDRLLDRTVAIKVLKFTSKNYETAIARFDRESKVLASLAHTNIVTVHRCGVLSNGRPFMIMDFVNGLSLREFLDQNKTRSGRDFHWIFSQALDALIAAHHESIIHRDIKPENIMITAAGRSGLSKSKTTQSSFKYQVHLLDFGIAKVATDEADGSVTGTTVMIGTPKYMSPEQCKSRPVDARSDIYSLACIMYEFITGHTPFEADNPIDAMFRRANESPSSLFSADHVPKLSARMQYLLQKALATSPDERYQSAQDLLSDLNNLTGADLRWTPSGQKPQSMSKWIALLVTAAVVTSYFGLIVFKIKGPGNPAIDKSLHLEASERDIRQYVDRGNSLKQEGKFEEALKNFSAAYDLAKNGTNIKMKMECLKQIGFLQLQCFNDYPAAITAFKGVLALSKQYVKASRIHCECREWLADAYKMNADYKNAIVFYREAAELRLIREMSRVEGLMRIRNRLAECLYKVHQPKEAEALLQTNWLVLTNPDTEYAYNCEDVILGLELIDTLRAGGEVSLARERMKAFAKIIPEIVSMDPAGPSVQVYSRIVDECKLLNLSEEFAQYSKKLGKQKTIDAAIPQGK